MPIVPKTHPPSDRRLHAHLEQLVRARVPGEELTYANVKSILVERHGAEIFNRNKVSG